jgi:hypothetical protein
MTVQMVTPNFPTASDWMTTTYLYVSGVPDRGPVKIGISAEPELRLRALQTAQQTRSHLHRHDLVRCRALNGNGAVLGGRRDANAWKT